MQQLEGDRIRARAIHAAAFRDAGRVSIGPVGCPSRSAT